MDYQLWLIKETEMINLTPMVGEISWESHVDQLGQQLTFNFARGDTRYIPKDPCQLGDMVLLKKGKEILRGIIVSNQINETQPRQYTVMDFAFYLNKSEGVYQFNSIEASQAITEILKDYNIPIVLIPPMGATISKIYQDMVISDIIKDILTTASYATGQKYHMEMHANGLIIYPQVELKVKGYFKLASNLQGHDLQAAISSPSRSQSIEDIKTSIKLVHENQVVAHVQDNSLIEKYGLLQQVEEIDEDELPRAKSMAEEMLREMGKILESNSVTMLGDAGIRAGRIIEIEEPITGMTGDYLIKGCTHTVKNGIHTMSLDLGVTP
ncbi:XkdQ/YqbQ family protein [Alkaliphilus crotonatoxidans]